MHCCHTCLDDSSGTKMNFKISAPLPVTNMASFHFDAVRQKPRDKQDTSMAPSDTVHTKAGTPPATRTTVEMIMTGPCISSVYNTPGSRLGCRVPAVDPCNAWHWTNTASKHNAVGQHHTAERA